jgi:hypothetical protein
MAPACAVSADADPLNANSPQKTTDTTDSNLDRAFI